MVAGVDRFRAHFSGHEHQYVLIGGAACELIMEEAGLDFRATKDLDIVLIVEALDPAFSETFMVFVEAGGYEIRQRSEGERILYRFAKPSTEGYPAMLELFSNEPEGFELAPGRRLRACRPSCSTPTIMGFSRRWGGRWTACLFSTKPALFPSRRVPGSISAAVVRRARKSTTET